MSIRFGLLPRCHVGTLLVLGLAVRAPVTPSAFRIGDKRPPIGLGSIRPSSGFQTLDYADTCHSSKRIILNLMTEFARLGYSPCSSYRTSAKGEY